MNNYIYEGSEWTFDAIEKIYDACEEIALKELNLNIYTNQLEIIPVEQMLDAYASHGLPIFYRHWSFGKHFLREERKYKKGYSGLAYEMVINSNPCINYLMEENSITTQAAVIAHAAFGHNHFFKNNYLFKQWTDAKHILDYLQFARNYISKCEEKHGFEQVESFLDSCHALENYGINKYVRPEPINAKEEEQKQKEREEYLERHYNDLWRTVPEKAPKLGEREDEHSKNKNILEDSEENILYFLEKNSPILETWQREIIRIIRKINQYFYPQIQTKMMNEGFACFTHHYIMNRLYDKGLISEGAMFEFIKLHAGVINQPGFDSPYYSGINPYNLGYHMFQDIKRVCTNPKPEDYDYLPDIAGKDWLETILDAVANYRDESFVRQFLSMELVRQQKLFVLHTDSEEDEYEVKFIHNKSGFRQVRERLAEYYMIENYIPDVQITDVNLMGDRTLKLTHFMRNSMLLRIKDAKKVAHHVQRLWGYNVEIESVNNDNVIWNHEDISVE